MYDLLHAYIICTRMRKMLTYSYDIRPYKETIMKKNASVLNKTATVILLIFSVAFFLYGIYMVMYSVRYIQEYDSMAGTVDAARYVISACASYFGFALTLAAGTLCLVNLRSVSYVRDAGYMEENFPGKDGTADIPVADPFPPVAEIPVAAGSDQIGAPGYIEISKILSEAENTENESVSDKISEEILENDADTDNETVEELTVTVPEDEPAPAQGAADEDSESDATENDANDETAEVEEEQTLHDDIENEIENENASETPDDTPDPQEDGAATEEVPPQKNDAAVYHERISSSMIKDIFEGR